MKDYVINIEKIQTAAIKVPAKNKKAAVRIAERFINDIKHENININSIIEYDPEFKIKVKTNSTHGSAFFIGGKSDVK